MAGSTGTETKKDKFKRLAEARTNKTLDMIRLLENLSNTANYEYDQADVGKIFDRIERELRRARESFNKSGKSDERKFKL